MILETRNLAIGYRTNPLASNLNVGLQPGQLTVLLGANGSGKSTLLRTLCGTHAPLQGDVLLEGKPLKRYSLREIAERISMVYTDRTVAGGLRVDELVNLGRHPYTNIWGRIAEADRRAVGEALSATGIAHLADRYVATLSDGERQRAMLARALAQSTPLIVLDEPTTFLDVEGRLATLALLSDLAHKQGKAILLSTHEIAEALPYADAAWLLTPTGMQAGTVKQLIDNGGFAALFAPRLRFDAATLSYTLAR